MIDLDSIKLTDDNLTDTASKAGKVIKRGGTIIYPTDTLYGIGGDATSEQAVKDINLIKRVPAFKPMSVIVSDISMVEEYCIVERWQRRILSDYLPGPFTFILKARGNLPVTDNDKMGIRIPDVRFCRMLSSFSKRPIITTSANVNGEQPPYLFESVDEKIIQAVDLAIDQGPTSYRHHSSIVDLVDRKVIRRGKDFDPKGIF